MRLCSTGADEFVANPPRKGQIRKGESFAEFLTSGGALFGLLWLQDGRTCVSRRRASSFRTGMSFLGKITCGAGSGSLRSHRTCELPGATLFGCRLAKERHDGYGEQH
jgi:hypothetical protein